MNIHVLAHVTVNARDMLISPCCASDESVFSEYDQSSPFLPCLLIPVISNQRGVGGRS